MDENRPGLQCHAAPNKNIIIKLFSPFQKLIITANAFTNFPTNAERSTAQVRISCIACHFVNRVKFHTKRMSLEPLTVGVLFESQHAMQLSGRVFKGEQQG